MRILFKKSLALCLAIALCLTAMVGLTVSADETVPSEIVADNVTVDADATSASFDVTFKAADLSEVMLTITTDATVAGITCVENENYELFVSGNQFFFSSKKVNTTNETAINEAKATIALTFDALAAGTSFNVQIDLPEGRAATDKELLIASATKIITVMAQAAQPVHTHTDAYTDNGDGTHTTKCADVACPGGYEAVTVNHTYTEGKCVCGAEEPAEDTCEHDWTVTNAVAAVYQGALGSLDMKCAVCDETVSTSAVEYNAYYSFFANSASFEEQILVNFKGITEWLPTEYDEFVVVFEKDVFEGESIFSTATFEDGAPSTNINLGGANYPSTSWSVPIAAKEMNDKINAIAFVQIDGVWYSGMGIEKNFVDYATQLLSSSYDSNVDLQKFVANALYYGGKAQINFKYDMENPAYSYIPADYESYINKETPSYSGAIEGGGYTAGDKTFLRASSMSAESRTEMNHKFLLMDASADISKVTIVATFDKDGTPSTTEFVYIDVASQEKIDNSETFSYLEQDSGLSKYGIAFAGLAAKEMRKVVTFETYYDGELCASTYSCSLENLINRTIQENSTNQALIDMLHAMLNYGDSAAAYFS